METHLDHDEKDADRTKNSLGWCDARYLLRDVQDIDSHIQRGDDLIPAFRWFGFGTNCVHGTKLAQPREMLEQVCCRREGEAWAGQGGVGYIWSDSTNRAQRSALKRRGSAQGTGFPATFPIDTGPYKVTKGDCLLPLSISPVSAAHSPLFAVHRPFFFAPPPPFFFRIRFSFPPSGPT